MTKHTQWVTSESRMPNSRALASSYHVILSDFFSPQTFCHWNRSRKRVRESGVSEDITEREAHSRQLLYLF